MEPPGLERFVAAQDRDGTYARTLSELRAGRKQTHWMWFVFPQISGLGHSQMAYLYAISGAPEAQRYLEHRILGPRLLESTQAVLDWSSRKSAAAIFGTIDAMKFRSSMTLFEAVGPDQLCFAEALDSFYDGQRDPATLANL
ncbi:MAG: DUF1810 domain-containing protein [Novosphingobium sp.]